MAVIIQVKDWLSCVLATSPLRIQRGAPGCTSLKALTPNQSKSRVVHLLDNDNKETFNDQYRSHLLNDL